MNEGRPIVSIITVCFNEKERIRQTLESVVKQDYPAFELIVVDGASTDGTLDILNEFREQASYLLSERDLGVYHAMNKGVSLARGEYIHFLNGGDEYHDNQVLTRVFARGDTRSDIIYGDINLVYPDGTQELKRFPVKLSPRYLTLFALNHQASFFATKLFRQPGLFNTQYRICADYEHIVKAVVTQGCSTCHKDVVVANFYKDGLSSQAKYKRQKLDERLSIQKTLMPRHLYYANYARHWMSDNKDKLMPKWAQRVGNRLFDRIFTFR